MNESLQDYTYRIQTVGEVKVFSGSGDVKSHSFEGAAQEAIDRFAGNNEYIFPATQMLLELSNQAGEIRKFKGGMGQVSLDLYMARTEKQ